jgi:glycerophosphoryl diester phosphodiesterase
LFQCKSTIIAHRGWWVTPEEKNTEQAFIKALQAGFGIETDIRDLDGELVVSHDMPTLASTPMPVARFFELYNQHTAVHTIPPMLALNMKCDGLTAPLLNLLKAYNITRYFVFDMSIPDTLHYIRAGLNTFTRLSDIEPQPLLLEACQGVWIDSFYTDWVTFPLKLPTLSLETFNQKQLCLVSPELHKRQSYKTTWQQWQQQWVTSPIKADHLFLCTDFPMEAFTFFND